MHWAGRNACQWDLRSPDTASSASSWLTKRSGLADLPAARQPTIAVPGQEQAGIPPEALDLTLIALRGRSGRFIHADLG